MIERCCVGELVEGGEGDALHAGKGHMHWKYMELKPRVSLTWEASCGTRQRSTFGVRGSKFWEIWDGVGYCKGCLEPLKNEPSIRARMRTVKVIVLNATNVKRNMLARTDSVTSDNLKSHLQYSTLYKGQTTVYCSGVDLTSFRNIQKVLTAVPRSLDKFGCWDQR